MWKNSSWTLSLPAINWISSINKTSILLYLFLKNSFLLSLIAFINWFVNFSEVTYRTLEFLLFSRILFPIACIKWVLPKPTPPYKNNGLYEFEGSFPTANAAAWANLLLFPTTKVSNVYLGFNVVLFSSISGEDASCLSSVIMLLALFSFVISITENVQSLFVIYLKVLKIKVLYLFSIKSFWNSELVVKIIWLPSILLISKGIIQVS